MLFQPEKLSLGIVLPIQPRTIKEAETTDIDFALQLDLAARADALGFAALWVRDVPLNSPAYPDPIGHSDPFVLLGALAAMTRRITLATGAIVLPLRHPLHIAKAALSLDALSGGRFLLGLGSGDRPSEFRPSAKTLPTDVSFSAATGKHCRQPLQAISAAARNTAWHRAAAATCR